jgi:hypothetical protein
MQIHTCIHWLLNWATAATRCSYDALWSEGSVGEEEAEAAVTVVVDYCCVGEILIFDHVVLRNVVVTTQGRS